MKTVLCAVFLVMIGFTSASDTMFGFCEDMLEHEIYLDLSGIGITKIKESFVVGDFIKCLNLGDNELSTINDGAFAGLQGLVALNLSKNSLNLRNFLLIPELMDLKTLVLDRAFTVQHNEHNFYGHYPIYTAPDTPLELSMSPRVRKLEKLSLSHYRTEQIRNWLDEFGAMTHLTHLRLIDNKLTDLEYFPRTVLQGLTHLWLDDNEITTFPGLNLPKVRFLSMNCNQIKKLCGIYCNSGSMSPFSMVELEYLSLERNEIGSVEANVFVNSANLTTLNLARNSIQTFPWHTFENTTALENLHLEENMLQHVPDLTGLINLRELWIDGNRIESLDEKSFCELPKLAFISLRNNQLSMVATGTFRNLPMLRVLDLSGNNLVQLPPNWMGVGSQLDSLNLEKNLFTDILDMALEQFEILKILNIGRNPITTVTIRSLIHLPLNTTLDLDYGCKNTDLLTSTDRPQTTTSPNLYYYG